MLNLTPAAAEQIRNAAFNSGAGDMPLRIAAHYDEASHEMHYGIGFDEIHDDDQAIEVEGVTLLVSPLSKDALADLTIDYVEIEPGDFRFIFYRPGDLPPAAGCPGGGCSGACSGSGRARH